MNHEQLREALRKLIEARSKYVDFLSRKAGFDTYDEACDQFETAWRNAEEALAALEREGAEYRCERCRQPMRFNVPRLGPNGGFVHSDTGSLDCTTPPAAEREGAGEIAGLPQPVAWTDGVSLEWMPGHPKATTDKRTPLYSHLDMAEAIFQRDLARADCNDEVRAADELVQRFNAMKHDLSESAAAWRNLHDERLAEMRRYAEDAARYRYLRRIGARLVQIPEGWLSGEELDESIDRELDRVCDEGKS